MKTNKAEHTPGSWIKDKSHSGEWKGTTIWASDVVIAYVVSDQHGNEKANANLIASAPELLRVAKLTVRFFEAIDMDPSVKLDLQTTITKAEGG